MQGIGLMHSVTLHKVLELSVHQLHCSPNTAFIDSSLMQFRDTRAMPQMQKEN